MFPFPRSPRSRQRRQRCGKTGKEGGALPEETRGQGARLLLPLICSSWDHSSAQPQPQSPASGLLSGALILGEEGVGAALSQTFLRVPRSLCKDSLCRPSHLHTALFFPSPFTSSDLDGPTSQERKQRCPCSTADELRPSSPGEKLPRSTQPVGDTGRMGSGPRGPATRVLPASRWGSR